MDWRTGVSLLVLLINTGRDLCERKICLVLTLGYLLGGVLFGVQELNQAGCEPVVEEITFQILWVLLSVLPGLLLCLISWISRGGIGMGDGLFFLGFGLWQGMEETISVMAFSFGIASMYAGFRCVRDHGRRKETIAFMPAVLCGVVGGLLL